MKYLMGTDVADFFALGVPLNSKYFTSLNTCAKRMHNCCCLPTPLSLASGGSLIFLAVVHHPVFLSSSTITLVGSVHKSRGANVVQLKR